MKAGFDVDTGMRTLKQRWMQPQRVNKPEKVLRLKLEDTNGYPINHLQELIALGVTNIFDSCAGGYLVMGSFSSSNILSTAGVYSKILTAVAKNQSPLVRKLATSNGYPVHHSQELIALGITNIFGPCAGGYLVMGNILSMAGSSSQFAGVFAGLMVVLALYLLMGVFAYTPLASQEYLPA